MNNDIGLLIETLSQLVKLNDDEKQIIMNNFTKYRTAQIQEILSDPIGYYATVKEEAMKQI
jgi:hypothetical protein